MKKFGNFLIVLLLIGAVLFVRGYVTLFVPLGSFAVFVSKTSGIYAKPVTNGVFCWRWERLIPTNSKLHIFSFDTHITEKTISGDLPSAKIMTLYSVEKNDFSYSMTVRSSVRLRENALPGLFEKGLESEAKLNEYVSQKSSELAQIAVSYVIQNLSPLNQNIVDADAVKKELEKNEQFDSIEIQELALVNVKLPDMALYEKARRSYDEYRAALDEEIMQNVNAGAAIAIQNSADLDRLEKLAVIIEKHPALASVLQKSDIER